MKSARLVFILFLGVLVPVQAQFSADFKAIDKYAKKVPEQVTTSIESLSQHLTTEAENDLEKVRSIYVWITHNISYDKNAYKNGNGRINKNNKDVLSRKTAVCFGYATLFKALCAKAGISCEVISGYSKGTLTAKPKLEEPDHAWNAVKIDSAWYLLDATWGSSLIDKTNDFVQTFDEGYFLTQPKYFVVNHLPADPMWQLLDCPIQPELFAQSPDTILSHIQQTPVCFNYQDSIDNYLKLPVPLQVLKGSQNAYRFHPTASNKKELGHAHFDYAQKKSEEVETYQTEEAFQQLIDAQEQVIHHATEAMTLTDLYVWQKEFLINALINQGVAYSRLADSEKAIENSISFYKKTLYYLEKAEQSLQNLPDSSFKSYASSSCTSFLAITRENLDLAKRRK